MSARRFLIAPLATSLLALGACSTGPAGGDAATDASPADAPTGTAEAGAYPVTVEHAFGSTTVEDEPMRIATVGWTDHDVLASLGVLPVGATRITWGGNAEGSTDWFDEAAEEIDPEAEITRYDDADGIPVEDIATLAPDLILGVNSGISQEEYDRLSQIAPTVAYPGDPWSTPWETQVDVIGEILGLEDEAARVKQETNEAIDTGLAQYPQLEGTSVAWAWFLPTDLSTIGLYTTNDQRPQMLRRFGMVDAPVVEELSAPGEFSATLSAERAAELEADVVVFYTEGADPATIVDHPLIGQVPAFQEGRYVASADNVAAATMSSPSPLSIPVAVEEFLPKLASAADGTPAS